MFSISIATMTTTSNIPSSIRLATGRKNRFMERNVKNIYSPDQSKVKIFRLQIEFNSLSFRQLK